MEAMPHHGQLNERKPRMLENLAQNGEEDAWIETSRVLKRGMLYGTSKLLVIPILGPAAYYLVK